MDTLATLEGRVASLEHALRRSRVTAVALGLAAVVVAAAALMPTSATPEPVPALLAAQEAQTPEQVATQRLVLTNGLGVEQIALVAGMDGSLVVLDPTGGVVIRLGGNPARPIKH